LTDSAHRTRAASIGVLKTVFTGGATVSDTVKNVTFDSVRSIRARHDTITSQAGASKKLVFRTTTSGSTMTTAMRFNEVQQALATSGSITRPGYSFASDTTSGMLLPAAGQVRIAANNGGNSTNILVDQTNSQFVVGTNASTTLTVSGGASASLVGGAGDMTIQAGTGNSRTMTLRTTTSGGVATDALTIDATQKANFASDVIASGDVYASGKHFYAGNGTAGNPSVSFQNGATMGLYRFGADTMGVANTGICRWRFTAVSFEACTDNSYTIGKAATFRPSEIYAAAHIDVAGGGVVMDQSTGLTTVQGSAASPSLRHWNDTNTGLYWLLNDSLATTTGGVRNFTFAGGANATLLGGAGNMTIQAGTGASRTLTLKTTTSGSAAQTNATFNADGSSTFNAITVSGCTGCGGNSSGPNWGITANLPGLTTNPYFILPAVTGVGFSGSNSVANTIYYVPFVQSRSCAIDSLGINAQLGGASSQVHVGIYSSAASGMPGSLLVDTGPIVTTASGYHLAAVSASLTAGQQYWAAFVLNNTNPSIYQISASAARSLGVDPAGIAAVYLLKQTFTYAALPSTAAPDSYVTTGTGLIATVARFSSCS
jgi:hypothetical protein